MPPHSLMRLSENAEHGDMQVICSPVVVSPQANPDKHHQAVTLQMSNAGSRSDPAAVQEGHCIPCLGVPGGMHGLQS